MFFLYPRPSEVRHFAIETFKVFIGLYPEIIKGFSQFRDEVPRIELDRADYANYIFIEMVFFGKVFCFRISIIFSNVISNLVDIQDVLLQWP